MIEKALKHLRNGEIILVFDGEGREEETDMVIPSQFISHEKIRIMRRDGGGLICTTLPGDIAEKIGLPYLHDILRNSSYEIFKYITHEVRYDKNPSFSITVNFRDNYTGISDRERAKTIKELANYLRDVNNFSNPSMEFGKRFISPGHVHLLISSGIEKRKGHTELSTALMSMAGLIPSATIVEILGDDGYSMRKNEAKKFAEKRKLIFLEGYEIVDAWSKWSE